MIPQLTIELTFRTLPEIIHRAVQMGTCYQGGCGQDTWGQSSRGVCPPGQNIPQYPCNVLDHLPGCSFTAETASCGIILSDAGFGLAGRAGRSELWGEKLGSGNTCHGCQGGLGGPKGSSEAYKGEEFSGMSEDTLQQADGAESAALVYGGHRARWNAHVCRIRDGADRHEEFRQIQGNSGDTILICFIDCVLAPVFACEACGSVPSLARR